MPRLLVPVVVAAWVSAAPSLRGQTPERLDLGEPAPPLAVGAWLKGGPVKTFEPGKIYVVDLCATWAPALPESIATLNAVHRSFADRGVVVIGVFVRENRRTDPAKFVQEQGTGIEYALAADDIPVPVPASGAPDDRLWAIEQGRMSLTWLKASGRDKLPAAWIVDQQGNLAWAGLATYPKGELEEALKRVLAGPFTPEQSRELSAQFKEVETKLEAAMARYRQALTQRDFKTAVAVMDEMAAIAPARMLTNANFVVNKLTMMLVEFKDEKGGYDFAKAVADGPSKENAPVLHAMAWAILDAKGLNRRDLDLAESLARRADELTEHKVPLVLDTLARVRFERGDLDGAIDTQRRAVEQQRAAGPGAGAEARKAAEAQLASLESTLKKYEAEKSHRGGG